LRDDINVFEEVFELFYSKINSGEKFNVPEAVYFRKQRTVTSYREAITVIDLRRSTTALWQHLSESATVSRDDTTDHRWSACVFDCYNSLPPPE